jgi:hypothetical protein
MTYPLIATLNLLANAKATIVATPPARMSQLLRDKRTIKDEGGIAC